MCMSVTYISVKYIPLCEVGNFLKFIVDVSYIIPSSQKVFPQCTSLFNRLSSVIILR